MGRGARLARDFAGVDVLHVSRHGHGHARLSNQVTHRANIAALHELGAAGVVAVTVCGAVDPEVELGSLICFDDLHFLANRLPTARCARSTTEPGDPAAAGTGSSTGRSRRPLRAALLARRARGRSDVRDGGCYGHVDGPRFNTQAEIRGLAAAGVTAVSQTAGPETVLAGEAELPFALLGYATDYANGVSARAHAGRADLARLVEGRQRMPSPAPVAAALPRLEGGAARAGREPFRLALDVS